jgi:pSer/pThr/pTyr-binding forkhead associated (FHA) protein
MYARLNSKTAALAGKSYEIVSEAVIGHGPECNLLIKSGVLSAKHARIFFDQKKGSYYLEDFKSHNGTLLDGKPVQGKVKLEKKHVIMFANTFTFIFVLESGQANDPLPPPPKDLPPEQEIHPSPRRKPSEPGGPAPVSGESPEPQAAKPAAAQDDAFGLGEPPAKPRPADIENVVEEPHARLPEAAQEKPPVPAPQARDAAPTMLIDEAQLADLLSLPRFVLEFKNVRGEKSSIDLKEGENTVGRLSTGDVAVDDASISRNHAIITVRAGKVALRDLGSKNGTYVGDKRIAADTEVAPDTPIRFGLVKATILKKRGSPA